MHRLSSARDGSFAGFATALAVFVFALALPSLAQFRGAPASVTSDSFGGHENHTPGVPASVTSLGPNGYGYGNRAPLPLFGATPYFPGNFVQAPGGNHFGNGGRGGEHRGSNGNHEGSGNHRRREQFPTYAPIYGYPYVYGYPLAAEPQEDPADQYPEEEYRGGPTIFDRRGPGPSRVESEPPPSTEPAHAESASVVPASAPEPAADQPSTVLVFKDGRQLEVQNYAIVGNMLVDMTDGHRRKVPLTDLDVAATSKQNDDRGIDFRLPNQPLAN